MTQLERDVSSNLSTNVSLKVTFTFISSFSSLRNVFITLSRSNFKHFSENSLTPLSTSCLNLNDPTCVERTRNTLKRINSENCVRGKFSVWEMLMFYLPFCNFASTLCSEFVQMKILIKVNGKAVFI